MLKKLIGIFLLATTHWVQAQSVPFIPKPKTSRDIIYAEFGGNSLIYSVNYERIIFSKPKFQFSLRAGFGSFPIITNSFTSHLGVPSQSFLTSNLSIPVEALFSFGGKNGKFELGVGYTNIIVMHNQITPGANGTMYNRTVTDYMIGVAPSFSYRYEKPEGGFFLKAGISPMLIFNTNPVAKTLLLDYPIPMPKFCIGYKFKVNKH